MAYTTANRSGVGTRALIHQIVVAQFIATGLAAAGCLLVSEVAAYSALLGGLTCAMPSALMAWRFGREVADQGNALVNLVRGETGKLVLTVAMFVVIFLLVKPLALGYFLFVLGLGFLCNLLVPMVVVMAAARIGRREDIRIEDKI